MRNLSPATASGPKRKAQPPSRVPREPSGSSVTPSSVTNCATMTLYVSMVSSRWVGRGEDEPDRAPGTAGRRDVGHCGLPSVGSWRRRRAPPTTSHCDGSGCVLWFLDTFRNGGRRWCSMAACGNRAKAHAHYHRGRGSAAAR
jgi:hypothetical protein